MSSSLAAGPPSGPEAMDEDMPPTHARFVAAAEEAYVTRRDLQRGPGIALLVGPHVRLIDLADDEDFLPFGEVLPADFSQLPPC
ncbi:MAG: hypothetical protein R2851_00570 [Caldilineaceae bacterium]